MTHKVPPANDPPPDVPRLATPVQLARYLHSTEANLAQMRYLGTGPKFIKVGGRRVLYSWDDVLEWIRQNTIRRTDDLRGGG
ncbi:hypothetical protein NJB18091_37170 [Mycobacterium marinum]|nr:DNA-binding protein [Mycobacterium marinum]GJO02350.1 hypothetical protein NJB18091_37170 [Mycobacterium marinum]